MKKLLLVALSTFAVSAHAWEPAWEPTYYAGSSVAFWQYKQSDPDVINANLSVQSLEGVAGVRLTPYTSVEARAGAGLNTARELTDEGTGHAELKMNYFGSVYFRPHLTNEKASLYGLIGMSTVSIEAAMPGATLAEGETTAVSYGIGVSFVMNPNVDFTAEWKRLINAEAFDMRGGSVGFVYKF